MERIEEANDSVPAIRLRLYVPAGAGGLGALGEGELQQVVVGATAALACCRLGAAGLHINGRIRHSADWALGVRRGLEGPN